MGMTRGHGTAAVVIGTLQLLVAGALVIASFVFASYGSMSASQTPYWGGFPVSVQTPKPLIILLSPSRF